MTLSRINAIIYHIQTNEQMELSDKSKYDIEMNVMNGQLDASFEARKDAARWHNKYLEVTQGKTIPNIYEGE